MDKPVASHELAKLLLSAIGSQERPIVGTMAYFMNNRLEVFDARKGFIDTIERTPEQYENLTVSYCLERAGHNLSKAVALYEQGVPDSLKGASPTANSLLDVAIYCMFAIELYVHMLQDKEKESVL